MKRPSSRSESDKMPDWEYWRHMPEVSLWQAVALSLNDNPDNFIYTRRIVSGATVDEYFSGNRDASKRLRLLIANHSDRRHFSACTLNMGDPRLSYVRLPEFAAWASAMNWDGLPRELVMMGRELEAQPLEPSAPPKVDDGETEKLPRRELTDESARHWLSMDGWTMEESAYLLHSIDPRYAQASVLLVGRRRVVVASNPMALSESSHMIARAFEAGALHSPAKPGDVIAWAKSKKLRLPRQFLDAGIDGTKKETPAERRARLLKTCNERKASGVKAWKKKTAGEERITTSMLDRILRRGSDSDKPKAGTIEALKRIGKK